MMSVRTSRPELLHLGLFTLAYVLGCGFAQALAIVPGTGISVWPPSGLFLATLILARKESWPWWVLGGCLAELLGNALWFGSPWAAAFLIYVGNALEAIAGAWLVNRALTGPVRLESLREVLTFVVLGAGIAPVISATIGSATLAWFGIFSQTFAGAWPLWWIGDATGVLIVAPLALVVFQNWHGKVEFSTARWVEAFVLGLIFLGVAALSLGGYLPFAYIIMPPLLWAAVRFEFKGAAVSLALLALITALFTLSGTSQFAGDPETQRHRQIMLQLFLVISAFSALIVAAISRQHQLTLLTMRQSVEALRDRERELSQIIDMVPVHIRRLTPEGEPTFFNKRLKDFFGLDLQQLSNPDRSRLLTAIQTLVHPDDADGLLQAVRRSVATGEPYSMKYRMRRADGVYRWVDGRAEPLRDEDGKIVQWFAISIDVDDELHAQQALHNRERELSQLVDMVPSHVWRLTRDGEPIFFNKRMVDFLGLDVAGMDRPGISPLEALIETVHPEDAAEFGGRLRRCLATGENFEIRYRLRRTDGVYRWMSSRAEPMRDEDGCIAQWYGLCHDVDDQMRVEEALRRSERELQQLIDALPVHIWSWTATGKLAYVSKRYLEHLGLTEANFEDFTRVVQELVHPEDSAEVQRTAATCLKTGEAFLMRYRRRSMDGTYRWMEGRSEPLRDQDGAIVRWYHVSIDIDDAVRAQEELLLAQERLARSSQAASLAELSASIAHEVNQPLAAIVANSHACYRWLSAEPVNVARAKITTERVIRDANSAADVVSRIRALFKQSVENRSSLALPGVIAEACSLVADEAFRRRIRIDTDVEGKLPTVAVDRIQIQQVLINLIRNGMEAMNSVAGDKALEVRAHRVGHEVQTEIADLGDGIEFPGRIFEPFFTTKETGMGMGLAICRSIVEAHGGRLWAENNEPRGARFIFTLPVAMKAAQ